MSVGTKQVRQIETVWSVLADLTTDFVRKGLEVRQAVTNLGLCKVQINHFRMHLYNECECSRIQEELFAQAANELRNLEDFLIINAVNHFGREYADEWTAKLMFAWTLKPKSYEVRIPQEAYPVPK